MTTRTSFIGPAIALLLLLSALGCEAVARPADPSVRRGPLVQRDLQDGPYLFHGRGGSVTAKWIRDGKLESKRFGRGRAIVLPRFRELLGERLNLGKLKPDRAIWPEPRKMLVVSDVEGQYDDFLRFLTSNGVVDRKGRWTFGKGHLVCVGDMVDRGTKVTETLWLIYRLADEAESAGGHVHHILGNHEVMVIGGDVRYTAPKYQDVATILGIPCEDLLGADTELGRWLRTRNCVERIGSFLFVHGGVSPSVGSRKLDLERLNADVRSVLGSPKEEISNSEARSLAWGRQGPLWYRGYFEIHVQEFGPTPTCEDLDRILANAGATTIVVGHTQVEQVTPLYGGRVLAIDTPWTKPDDVRGLLVRDDRMFDVDIRGKSNRLELAD